MQIMFLVSFLLVPRICDASSVFLSKPSIQRKSYWDRCTFQWSVAESPTNYTFHNLTRGTPLPLSESANHFYRANERGGTVTLNIWNIQYWDAGNYSLSVTTNSSTETDSSALLFLYVNPFMADINQIPGRIPVTIGQTVELTCRVQSWSLPAAYRPRMYYSWYVSSQSGGRQYVQLKNISSGPAIYENGDVLNGYSIKNDGGTLVIDSVQDHDWNGVQCRGKEEGSPYPLTEPSHFVIYMLLPPYTSYREPSSGRLIATIGSSVWVQFSILERPTLTTITNWTFVDTAGRTKNLPPTATPSSDHLSFIQIYSFKFAFELTSSEFYGNYSITLVNSLGSLTETFRVIPPGPPDAPSNFRVRFVSHAEILLEWEAILDKDYKQMIFLQVNAVGNESPVAKWASTVNEDPRWPQSSRRQNLTVSENIQPETDYEARIWSTNIYGSSEVVKLTVRTLKEIKLFVSPETVSLEGSRAIINYKTSGGNISSLKVSSCVGLTVNCPYCEFYLLNNDGQVIVDNLPDADEYVFDFTARATAQYNHSFFVAEVKGVRVSRGENKSVYLYNITNNMDIERRSDSYANFKICYSAPPDILELYEETIFVNNKNNKKPVPVAAVVLASVFGVVVLGLVECVVAFLVLKRRNKIQLKKQAYLIKR